MEATSFNWNDAIAYATLVQLAESTLPGAVTDTITVFSGETPRLYQRLATILVNDLASDINRNRREAIVPIGFVAQAPEGELVVSLRGTAGILEWLHDCEYKTVPCPLLPDAGHTEDGFTEMFLALRLEAGPQGMPLVQQIAALPKPYPVTRTTVCGHSLGGALATLVALDLRVNAGYPDLTLYTFASPRVGDAAFAEVFQTYIPRAFRVANRADIVTETPPAGLLHRRPYVHVESVSMLAPHHHISFHIVCMHHLSTYLFLMNREAGRDADPRLLHPRCFSAPDLQLPLLGEDAGYAG